MAEIYKTEKQYGVGKKVYIDTVSVANGGSVTLPGTVIEVAVRPTVSGHYTAASASGNTVTIELKDSSGSDVTTPEDVVIIAIISTE